MGTLLCLVLALVATCRSWALGTSKVAFGSYLDEVATVSGNIFLLWLLIFVVSAVLAMWVRKAEGRKVVWFDSYLVFALLAFRLARTLLFIGLAVQWGSLIVGFLGILLVWAGFFVGELMFSFGTIILSPKKENETMLVKLLYTIWEVVILF